MALGNLSKRELTKLVKSTFEEARKVRLPHENELNESLIFTTPARELFRKPGHEIDRTFQFDATASGGLYGVATMVLGLSVPPNSKWANISIRDDFDTPRVPLFLQIMLDRYNKVMFDTIRNSGFTLAFGTTLFDVLGPGTGVLAKYETVAGPKFVNIPIGQVYLLADRFNNIDKFFRVHQMSAGQIEDTWGEEELPRVIQQAITRREFEKTFEIVEWEMKVEGELSYGVALMDDFEHILCEPRKTKTFFPIRWNEIPGEPWGDGLVRQALPHIKTANQLRQLQLKHGEFMALGAWQAVGDSAINWMTTKIRAGRVHPVTKELTPLLLPGQFNITEGMLDREVAAIRNLLLADIFPAVDDSVRTAFEVGRRFEMFIQRAGQSAIRIEEEGLKPVMRALVTSLQIRNELPPLVQDGETFEFQVNSIIKRGRDLEELTKNMELFLSLQQVAAVDPSVLALVNTVDFARQILEQGGFTPDLIENKKTFDEKVAAQQQQQQQQMMLDKGGDVVDMMKGAAEAGINIDNLPETVEGAGNAANESIPIAQEQSAEAAALAAEA